MAPRPRGRKESYAGIRSGARHAACNIFEHMFRVVVRRRRIRTRRSAWQNSTVEDVRLRKRLFIDRMTCAKSAEVCGRDEKDGTERRSSRSETVRSSVSGKVAFVELNTPVERLG